MNTPLFPLRLPRSSRFLLAACLAMPLLACRQPIELHGNEPDPQALSQITPGHTTKADVTGLLGTPTSVSTFDPNTWYYVSRRMEGSSFSYPSLISQKVYVVEFDNEGVVKDLQTHLNDAPKVPMVARTTPAPGRELTLLQQLMGNFGRFNNLPAPSGGAGGTIEKN
jgi:outer membrane protein assembly factor BamE (lipoprotein component of BamABCDE complex)